MAVQATVDKEKADPAEGFTTAHQAALRYLRAGFSVIPIKENKTPALNPGFPFLKQKPTLEDLDAWYQGKPYLGVGIACGAVSSHLQVLDIEYSDIWEQFAELLKAELPGLLVRMPRVSTPGKQEGYPGYHLYFRSKVEPPGQKLARLTKEEAEQRTGDKGKTTAIEIKSSGYVVAPGSPGSCHPSGRLYSHVDGPEIIETPVISNEEAEAVYRCARALDRASPEEAAEQQATATPFAGKVGCSAGNRAGDRFNQLASWEDVFAGTGWKRWRCRGETQYWTRPGKEVGASGSTGFCHNSSGDLLFIFSSNAAPFEDGKAYNKFRAFTLLQHGGDFRAAAKAAAALFPDPEKTKQAEKDNEAIAELLGQLESDPQEAFKNAIDLAEVLARFKRDDPARFAQLMNEFTRHGLKAAEVRRLEQAVNAAKKKAKEAEREEWQKAAEERQKAQAEKIGLQFKNYFEETTETDEGKFKVIKKGLAIERCHDQLQAIAPDWPKRIGNRLFIETIERGKPLPLFLEKPTQLFSWIGKRLQTQHSTANPIDWLKGGAFNSEERFYSYLQQNAESFVSVEAVPHFPPMDGHYYIHPEIKHSEGKRLQELLNLFCCELIDRDLILAYLLTVIWGGKPGSRPAFLFTSEDNESEGGRGVGKTTIATTASKLFGGHISMEAREDIEGLKTRLLSPQAMTKRILLIDNMKSYRFSNDSLEALITCSTISGRLLFVGNGERPNTLTVAITANGARLSKDLAQRAVIVQLKRPKPAPTWQQTLDDLIENYRWEIIGDLIEILKTDPKPMAKNSRWASWESEVLSKASPDPAEAFKTIEERRALVDDDNEATAIVRDFIWQRLEERHHQADQEAIFIPTSIIADWVNTATGENRPVNKACSHLCSLGIPEIRPSRKGSYGYSWRGKNCPADRTMLSLNSLSGPQCV